MFVQAGAAVPICEVLVSTTETVFKTTAIWVNRRFLHHPAVTLKFRSDKIWKTEVKCRSMLVKIYEGNMKIEQVGTNSTDYN